MRCGGSITSRLPDDPYRHCERSEAIQRGIQRLDCFVAALLAMTAKK
jgi:hypothetical protein